MSVDGSVIIGAVSVVDAAVAAGFAASKSAARRLIESGGFRVQDVRVTDSKKWLVWTRDGRVMLIREADVTS